MIDTIENFTILKQNTCFKHLRTVLNPFLFMSYCVVAWLFLIYLTGMHTNKFSVRFDSDVGPNIIHKSSFKESCLLSLTLSFYFETIQVARQTFVIQNCPQVSGGVKIKITHDNLITLANSKLREGLSMGFSGLFGHSVLSQDEATFYGRLHFIATYNENFPRLVEDIREVQKST